MKVITSSITRRGEGGLVLSTRWWPFSSSSSSLLHCHYRSSSIMTNNNNKAHGFSVLSSPRRCIVNSHHHRTFDHNNNNNNNNNPSNFLSRIPVDARVGIFPLHLDPPTVEHRLLFRLLLGQQLYSEGPNKKRVWCRVMQKEGWSTNNNNNNNHHHVNHSEEEGTFSSSSSLSTPPRPPPAAMFHHYTPSSPAHPHPHPLPPRLVRSDFHYMDGFAEDVNRFSRLIPLDHLIIIPNTKFPVPLSDSVHLAALAVLGTRSIPDLHVDFTALEHPDESMPIVSQLVRTFPRSCVIHWLHDAYEMQSWVDFEWMRTHVPLLLLNAQQAPRDPNNNNSSSNNNNTNKTKDHANGGGAVENAEGKNKKNKKSSRISSSCFFSASPSSCIWHQRTNTCDGGESISSSQQKQEENDQNHNNNNDSVEGCSGDQKHKALAHDGEVHISRWYEGGALQSSWLAQHHRQHLHHHRGITGSSHSLSAGGSRIHGSVDERQNPATSSSSLTWLTNTATTTSGSSSSSSRERRQQSRCTTTSADEEYFQYHHHQYGSVQVEDLLYELFPETVRTPPPAGTNHHNSSSAATTITANNNTTSTTTLRHNRHNDDGGEVGEEEEEEVYHMSGTSSLQPFYPSLSEAGEITNNKNENKHHTPLFPFPFVEVFAVPRHSGAEMRHLLWNPHISDRARCLLTKVVWHYSITHGLYHNLRHWAATTTSILATTAFSLNDVEAPVYTTTTTSTGGGAATPPSQLTERGGSSSSSNTNSTNSSSSGLIFHHLRRSKKPYRAALRSHALLHFPGLVPRLELHYDTYNPLARECYEELKLFSCPPGESPDLIGPIGGDGYMMTCVRANWRRFIPFYGINAGHVGHLLNSASQLHELFEYPLNLHVAPMLYVQCEVAGSTGGNNAGLLGHTTTNNNNNNNNNNNGLLNAPSSSIAIKSELAFNDAWVERSSGQTAHIKILINGEERIPKLKGDGILVSTAAGSTAYSRALGASPVPIGAPLIQIVGSNVVSPPQWRPAHLEQEDEVELIVLDEKKRPCRAFVDAVDVGLVSRLLIRSSRVAGVTLAYSKSCDLQNKLYELQFPSTTTTTASSPSPSSSTSSFSPVTPYSSRHR